MPVRNPIDAIGERLITAFTDIRIFGGALHKEGMEALFHIEPEERLRLELQSLDALFEGPLEKPPVLPPREGWARRSPGRA